MRTWLPVVIASLVNIACLDGHPSAKQGEDAPVDIVRGDWFPRDELLMQTALVFWFSVTWTPFCYAKQMAEGGRDG
jgi:hypothetical protein